MSYDEFEHKLQEVGLSKKEFATIVDMSYTSVTNWKQSDIIPKWVNSWLENYAKAKTLDDIAQAIKPYV